MADINSNNKYYNQSKKNILLHSFQSDLEYLSKLGQKQIITNYKQVKSYGICYLTILIQKAMTK